MPLHGRTKVGNLFTALSGVANIGAGGFCVYKYWDAGKAPQVFLSVYLGIFGLLMVISCIDSFRTRFTIATEGKDPPLGFLGSSISLSLFVIFVGTLGLGYGFDAKESKQLVPFCVGCFTVVVAFVVTGSSCCVNEDMVVADRQPKPSA
ncbi:hypothetical protein DIPPA_34563 [Diplonema papillatum]|nr:hypothetical protein DIPPA_34563 [Diplonema papillatum]